MGDDYKPGLLYRLWKHKLIIALALVALALAASTYYYYGLSNDRAAALGLKNSEYDALNATYNDLSAEHAALVASDENLTMQYESLSGQYDSLVANTSAMRSDYANLSATVNLFQETGGASLALRYEVHRMSTPDGPKVFVNATVYNVGNSKADRVVIKCKVIYQNQPDVDEHVLTDVPPLAKKSLSWSYSSYTDIDALWI